MTVEELYNKTGGDYANVKSRLQSDDLIKMFLKKFVNDKSYDELLKAAAANNVKEAELAAHKLKGVVANMSFDVLFKSVTALMMKLREENQQEVDMELLQRVKEDYAFMVAAINEI